jgi:hypothetical protein
LIENNKSIITDEFRGLFLVKRKLTALLIGTGVLMGAAGGASAHSHQILTPGKGDPIISLEPFHGTDPTNGAITNNPNVAELYSPTHGLHPIHYFLHMGPGQENSNIQVVRQ